MGPGRWKRLRVSCAQVDSHRPLRFAGHVLEGVAAVSIGQGSVESPTQAGLVSSVLRIAWIPLIRLSFLLVAQDVLHVHTTLWSDTCRQVVRESR